MKEISYINYQALTDPVVRFVEVGSGKQWDDENSELALKPTYGDTAIALAEDAYINGIPVRIPEDLPAGNYDMIFYDASTPDNADAFKSVFRIEWSGSSLNGMPIPLPITLV